MQELQRNKTTINHRNRYFEISYFIRRSGPSSIIYLHGLGNTSQDFEGALSAEELNAFTLLAYDFPGCGRSATYYNEIALGMDDLAAITHKLILTLELDDVTIIGQSLGGLVGHVYALTYPEHLARLISVEGNMTPQDCDIQSRDVFRLLFLGHEDEFFADVEKRLNDPNRAGFDNFVANMRKNIADRAYFDFCRSIVDYSDGAPLLEQFVNLPVPALFVHGSDSHLPYLEQLAESDAKVASISDSDHFPTLTNPKEFYAAVAEFIRESTH